jgi:hypothetical protein
MWVLKSAMFLIGALGSVCSILSFAGVAFNAPGAKVWLLYSVCVTVVAVFVWVVSQTSFLRAPLFSWRSEEDLFLEDEEGKLATWRSVRHVMTLAGSLAGIRTMVDATGEQPRMTARLNGEQLAVRELERRGTQTDIGIDFPRVLRRLRCYVLATETVYQGTYTGQSERFFLRILHPAVRLRLTVHFPQKRPPKSVQLEVDDAGVTRDAGKGKTVTDAATGQRVVHWTRSFASPGQVYRMKWTW